jgi:hypothetical protein
LARDLRPIKITNNVPRAAFGFDDLKQPRVSGLCELVSTTSCTAIPIPSPEPASLALLGTGVLGLCSDPALSSSDQSVAKEGGGRLRFVTGLSWGAISVQAYRKIIVLVVGVCISAAASQAATITEPFSAPDINNVGVFGGGSDQFFQAATVIDQFNPALGLLTNVTVSLTGQFAFSGGGSSDVNSAAIGVAMVGFEFAVTNSSVTGNGPVTFNGFISTSNTGTLSSFTGPGQLTPLVEGTNTSTTSLLSVSLISGNVTYTYTPSLAVPEPGSFALLWSGLLGLFLAGTRRRR